MIWQDVVLSVGQWIFILALLPSVLGQDKPAFITSLITGSVLGVFAITFSTLALWFSAISTASVSFVWFFLAIQKYVTDRKTGDKTAGVVEGCGD